MSSRKPGCERSVFSICPVTVERNSFALEGLRVALTTRANIRTSFLNGSGLAWSPSHGWPVCRIIVLNAVEKIGLRQFPERPIVGVGAIIVEGTRVLLVRRAAEPLRGEWSIPGGMLELGETLRAGAEREALEETGMRVSAGEVVDVFDSIIPGPAAGPPQHHYVLVDFLCTVEGGAVQAGSDASEARWFEREELAAARLREMTLSAIEKAFALRAPGRADG
ncbi:MAG: NUDIX hydrolase [Acidobacteria bacterium]|nr:NUDIX hydrolase [Acidobacteriota bacterium]